MIITSSLLSLNENCAISSKKSLFGFFVKLEKADKSSFLICKEYLIKAIRKDNIDKVLAKYTPRYATVHVTKTQTDYCLAGNNPFLRCQSTMVLLISKLVSYFKKKGFEYHHQFNRRIGIENHSNQLAKYLMQ